MNKNLSIAFSLFLMAFAVSCSDNSSNNADARTEDDSFRQAQLEAQEVLRQTDNCSTLPLEQQGACLEAVQRNNIERELGL